MGEGKDQFNAGKPLTPAPTGADPRAYQYRPAININPPSSDHDVDYESLREFAKDYDLLARCLSRRKEELRTLHWSIQPRNRADKIKMHEIQRKNADAIIEIENFFRHPRAYMKKRGDKWIRMPRVDYLHWINQILDDMLVVDAIALYPERKRNGDMLGLKVLDGTTIKVLLDDAGDTPIPPNPAYQQWLFGMPRSEFTIEELVYRVYNPNTHSPYGVSVVEQILKHIQLALQQEKFTKSFFDDGAVPQMVFKAPADWTSTQMNELADLLNARLAGNPKALHEFNFIPDGSDPVVLKPFDWDPDLSKWIAALTCSLTGIAPSEINLEVHDSGLGGKSFGEIASEVHDRQVKFVSEFLQQLFTDIIQIYFENDDLCFVFDHMLERDEKERAETNKTLLLSGQKSLDEIYIEAGKTPPGVGPIIQANDRLYGLPDLLTLSKSGSTAVNLGQVGGHKLPDGSTTEDIDIPNKGSDVKTPNPNQSKDPSAKLDAKTDAPDDAKSQPPKPPKQPEGTSYPTGPTVNTKSTIADLVKSAESDKEKRETHELEMIFLATYYQLFKRVAYASSMLNSQMAMSAFHLSQHQRQQLFDAIYALKKGVYIESYNTYAKQHGISSIAKVDSRTDALLRQSTQDAVDSILATYAQDLKTQYAKLNAAGVVKPQEMVDGLNEWLKERNRWKAPEIAVTEISEPWNQAIFNIDRNLGIQDDREYTVSPDHATCAVCQSLVANGPYDYETAISLPIPNHPGCIHFVTSTAKGGG